MEFKAEVVRLSHDGYSAGKIARSLNVTRNSVIGILYRFNKTAGRVAGTVRTGHPIPRTPRPVLQAPLPRRDASGSRISTETLGSADCRWPYGEPRSVEFYYCAQPKVPDSSYCEYHRSRARSEYDRFRARDGTSDGEL